MDALLSAAAGRARRWRRAGVAVGLAVAALARAASPVDDPGYHSFTDNQGHAFRAQFLSFAGTTVNLQRDDGSKLTEPVSSLSPDDQLFVVQSALDKHRAGGQAVLAVTWVTVAGDKTSAKVSGGTQVTWPEHYRLDVKNQTMFALPELQAKIIVFKALRVPDVPGQSGSNITLLAQTEALPFLPANGQQTLQTDPLLMQQVLANDGGMFADAPAAHAKTDKLLAVWVRFYLGNKLLVQEWCSNPSLLRQQSWAEAWALANSSPNTRAMPRGVAPALPNPYATRTAAE